MAGCRATSVTRQGTSRFDLAKDFGSFATLEKRMMKQDRELEPFGRLVEALNPWRREVVVIGGWAHRLYRLDTRSQKLTYPPLTTLDSDIAVPAKVAVRVVSIRDRLLAAGFQEEFVGEDRPPATHYHLHAHKGFYVEFLTLLVGSEYTRTGKRKATQEVGYFLAATALRGHPVGEALEDRVEPCQRIRVQISERGPGGESCQLYRAKDSDPKRTRPQRPSQEYCTSPRYDRSVFGEPVRVAGNI